ncbi:MAG: hypothetical protein IPK08_10510 [Bacteroidetes bacterium]|nr:hypothetical protein [Bacteroidota bacterium]MBK8415419.1 hypothetical protein [Bacteroidota bacterium]MBK9047431.1 hypothetical protein [Bacteroidota bacterium]
MFPIQYKKQLSIPHENAHLLTALVCIENFSKLVDDPVREGNDTLLFSSFNMAIKRHSWMDNGKITFRPGKTEVLVDLELNFRTQTIWLGIGTVALGLMQIQKPKDAFLSILLLWILSVLLYFWTITMYKMNIRNHLKRWIEYANQENS